MLIWTTTFRAVFEEGKSQLLRHIEAGGEYLKNTPSGRYMYITRGDKP
jgi:hypothetical protein